MASMSPTARRALRPLLVTLALIFLVEAWLWDHLEPIVARIVGLIPWGPFKLWLRRLIEKLPPWACLVVFVVPVVLLFPLKIVGLWLIAHKQWVAATLVYVFAKMVGLGVTAFVFDVTRDKLLQMAWFRRMYDWFLWARAWAHGYVDPIKARLKRFFRLFAP